MRRVLLRSVGAIALLPVVGAGPNGSDAPPDNVIVVTGQRLAIVVNGRSIKCRPLANDPQDKVNASPDGSERRESVLVPLSDGHRFELIPWNSGDAWSRQFFDFKRYGGPDVWRRTGTGIDQYIFRGPKDASLLCIGSKWADPAGFAQLVQIVDAAPYYGKRVRFTAWVASRNATLVNFHLASGDPGAVRLVVNGGNTNNHSWGGSHGWTPIMIEIGPISKYSKFIGFGFLLHGSGDVWLYKPKLETVAPDDPYQRKGDVFVIGKDRDGSARQTSAGTNER